VRVIDFHNHHYPPRYMHALQSGQSREAIDARAHHFTALALGLD
jgi:hypothetical protein